MLEFMTVIKALADENRVRALLALRSRELCVCQITELLELAPSTVSKHMSILKQARLVDSRKEGRWIYYRLAEDDAPPNVSEAHAWVMKALSDDSQTHQDDLNLKRILKLEPEVLCKRQART